MADSYPSPCLKCKIVKNPNGCGNKNCQPWKIWFLWHWKRFNAYAKKVLPDYDERQRAGVHYDDKGRDIDELEE